MSNASHFDLIANLLAEENLTVIRKNIKTAQFDIKTRVLTLPIWRYMSPELEGMLVSHEVGHALFTNIGSWFDGIQGHANSNAIMSYFNIIEDVRIERLMKRLYPGIRKTFYLGYQDAMANDIFSLSNVDVESLNLIDRINLYFKVGSFVTIPFNADERRFLAQANKIETVDEAYAFALELYAHAKIPKEEIQHLESDEYSTVFVPKPDDEESDENDVDGDVSSNLNTSGKNDDKSEEVDTDSIEDEPEDEPEDMGDDILPTTNDNFDSAINGMIEYSNKNVVYFTTLNTYPDPIIGYKQVCTDFKNLIEESKGMYGFNYDAEIAKYASFMEQSKRNVAYMVKEFEMRKAATAYSRSQVAKSGSLNMNKVFAYRINDDLFKRVVKVANGQNHGMIMLVDWSSSMDSVIHNVLEQVINLSMFCRRINIPFEVYAFTSQYPNSGKGKMNVTDNNGPTLYTKKYQLLNLFSSKMTEAEFNFVAKNLLVGKPYMTNYLYTLYDTPLNDALVYMLDFIPKYLKESGVEKLTFITLSDGESRPLDNTTSVSYYNTNYILDTVTKKTYKFRQNTVPTLLAMIKDRYGVTCLGFDILDKRQSASATIYQRDLDRLPTMEESMKFNAAANKDGFVTITSGNWDALFAILPKKLAITDVELEKIGAKATVASIAKQFGATVASGKNSRVLLGQFVGYIA